ncbi:hypothetical protein D3C86_1946070 [compost metagenome]
MQVNVRQDPFCDYAENVICDKGMPVGFIYNHNSRMHDRGNHEERNDNCADKQVRSSLFCSD